MRGWCRGLWWCVAIRGEKERRVERGEPRRLQLAGESDGGVTGFMEWRCGGVVRQVWWKERKKKDEEKKRKKKMREQKEKKGSIMSKKDEVFREMDQNLLETKMSRNES